MVSDSIFTALNSSLSEGNFPLHKPLFYDSEQRYVHECIASTDVSSVGAYFNRFRNDLAVYPGYRRALLPITESLERWIMKLPSSAGLA